MLNIKPIITDDGTISLYNNEVKDIYHSKIGAYTESLYKFILPSGILDFVKNNNEVKFLDICYGLGYNTKVAINEIWKINPNCKIAITAIEMDPQIVFLSAITNFNGINNKIKNLFFDLISSHKDFNNFKNTLYHDVNFSTLINLDEYFNQYKTSARVDSDTSIHNIYYRTISERNKINEELRYENNLLNMSIFISDARCILSSLKDQYDYIFHDPFTPSKLPTLWTVEFFKLLYKHMNNNGNLTTYSSSATIRAGMIEAGFYVGQSEPIGRKSTGTIGYKNKHLIKSELNKYNRGLLETNSGIPYYDPDLSFTSNEILKYRENIQKNSHRISTSRYIKDNKKYNNDI